MNGGLQAIVDNPEVVDILLSLPAFQLLKAYPEVTLSQFPLNNDSMKIKIVKAS